jgi:hypothetical protein
MQKWKTEKALKENIFYVSVFLSAVCIKSPPPRIILTIWRHPYICTVR